MDILPDTFHDVQSQPGMDRHAGRDTLNYLIDELGVRAKLAMLSLVTGQLYIDFDFHPGTPAQLFGFSTEHDELPTLPSDMEQLQQTLQHVMKNLQKMPVREVLDKLASALEGISGLVNAQATRDTPQVLHDALANARDLAARLNEEVTPLARSLERTSDQANAAFADARQIMRDERGEVVRLAQSVERAADEAREVLRRTGDVVSAVDVLAVERLVLELSSAARSIRVFADYLERHPEALIRGKN